MFEIHLKHRINHNDVCIDIKDQVPKIYAIKGPSGVGKTTILNIIAGLKQAQTAYIRIHHHELVDTARNLNVKIQQRNIGYLFQDYQLFPHMTVYQNITFMAEARAHIQKLMKDLNIEHLAQQYPMRLSGGEAQRVALARTLSTKPDLILLDEPFSSLDDQTKEEGIQLVRRIFKEWQIPIIFVTHSNYEAEALAHQVLTL